MASIVTCVVTSCTWCFCTAFSSLLGACCGNDKLSSEGPGPSSGRKRSVFLLFLSIGISLGFQYGLAPFFVDQTSSFKLVTNSYFVNTWVDGCEKYMASTDLLNRCAANNGNFRVAASTTLFFLLAAIAAACKPTANREAWPSKIILFLFLVGITTVIPNDPYFSAIYLNVGRVGGILFILVQQFIILDVAYNWNDKWVENANKAEGEEGTGAGNKWLGAILVSCLILFTVALAGLVLLFIYYTGCTSNDAFISLTLVFCVVITLAQLSGEESSLLSSACISAWAVFLCHSAVSKNPQEECNPKIGNSSALNVAVALCLTIASLCWAGWSWTAEDKFSHNQSTNTTEGAEAGYNHHADTLETKTETQVAVTGVVVGGTYGSNDNTDNDKSNKNESADDSGEKNFKSNAWKLNIALVTVSCWTSMVLTDWGAIQTDGTIANASTGRTAMWMIMTSQWVVLTLYLWTLVAPRIFPDRDFS